MRATLLGSVTGLLMCTAFGCDADDGRVDVYSVSGKVLVKGRPAEDAEVVFYP